MIGVQKYLPLGLIPLLWTASAFPQAKDTSPKKDDLYGLALFASIAEMQKSNGNIDDSSGGRIRTDYRHMIVALNTEITDDLPEQSGNFRVQYLGAQAMIQRFKTLHKEFAVLEIHPMRADGERLSIEVSLSWVIYKKKRLLFGFSDWADVDFKLDPEKHIFVISSVKLGGI